MNSSSIQENRSLVQSVGLVLIDEVHILNEDRGATLEAVVSRMRSVHEKQLSDDDAPLRFVAVSATCRNVEDIAAWLEIPDRNVLQFVLVHVLT